MVIKANPACLRGIGTEFPVHHDRDFGAVLIRFPLQDEVRFFPFTLDELVSPPSWTYPIMDQEFMSFEDFVLLDNDTHTTHHCSGLHWLIWYAAAKENWERFGGQPPPIGSTVQTLRSGFGGGAGVTRVIQAHPSQGDEHPYLTLSDPDNVNNCYCSDLDTWFRDFRVLTVPVTSP